MALIQTARQALDQAGMPEVGLLVGSGAPSTRATIKLVQEAARYEQEWPANFDQAERTI